MSAFWALGVFMAALIGVVLIFLVAGRVRENEARIEARRTAFFDSEDEGR